MTDSHSHNLSEELKQQLQALVPAAFKDGQFDVDTLQRLLGSEATPIDERYGLNWAGKADSYKALQYPTSATLRPRVDQSVDFEHAQHVFIEGENLEVLKVLQRAYFGKVKMIYIDPPYNTGSDSFIYPDRFQESREDYLKRIESLDIDGNITKEGLFRKNSKDNGHYHSNWLSMMLPRLYLARNLLRDDGVIFISIDDNEVANLKLICDEVFGAENFVAKFIHKNNSSKNQSKLVSVSTEYFYCYSRNNNELAKHQWRLAKKGVSDVVKKFNILKSSEIGLDEISKEIKELYKRPKYAHLSRWNKVNEFGVFVDADLSREGGAKNYTIKNPNTGNNCIIPNRGWGKSLEELLRLQSENLIWYGDESTPPRQIEYINADDVAVPDNFWYFDNSVDTREIKNMFGSLVFENPKPSEMIKAIISLHTKKNDLVLDFFAGSGTTAQAVMELNLEDGGNRQYICVQMPEPTDDVSEAYVAGYKNIAEISRERIRRVIERIKQNADLASPIDDNDPNLGFRAFELAPSNFKQWRGDWAETTEELDNQLALMLPTEKRGATSLDMAFELLLKNGRALVSNAELKTIVETTVYIIWSKEAEENTVALIFVLESMQLEALPAMLALKPKHMVFMDSVFNSNDSVKVNIALQCESAGVKFSSI